MANPYMIDISGGQDLSQGLGMLSRGLQMREERQKQVEKEAASKQLFQKAGELYKSGNIDDIIAFGIEQPELANNILGMINKKTGIRQDEMINAAKSILANPGQTEQVLTDRIAMIQERGGDPKDTIAQLEMYRENPDDFIKATEMTLAFADPASAKAYRDAQPKQPEPMTEYQKGTLDIQKEQNRLRALEIDEKKLERQLARAKTEKQTQEITAKLEAAKKEKEEIQSQDKVRIESSIYSIGESKRAVKDLLSNQDYIDDLTGVSGVVQGLGIRPTETAREAQILFDNITNEQTLSNLGKMSGPLTDKDVEVIRTASNRIREGMSSENMKKELAKILEAYDRIEKINREEAKRKGYSIEDQQPRGDDVTGQYTTKSGVTFRVVKP